jgi:ATP-dependent helicase/nuclease subunit A
MTFTPAQHDAITLTSDLVVTAGAGSGKTRVLVERYVRLLMECIHESAAAPHQATSSAEGILAITFTEKAAREMRDRIRTAVEERARAAPRAERPDWEARRVAVEAARIGTIHSFCATLLRSHPAEAGLDPRFRVLDEPDALLLLHESVDATLSKAIAEPHQPFSPLFAEFSPGELHNRLTTMLQGGPAVRAALHTLPDSAEVLQERGHAWLHAAKIAARDDLLTSAAWQNACDTLHSLATIAPDDDPIGRQVCALALWMAQREPECLDFSPVAGITLQGGSKKRWNSEHHLQTAKTTLKALRTLYTTGEPGGVAPRSVLELVPDADLEQYAAHIILALRPLYEQAQQHYRRRKAQQDALDFDDLEHHARALLETSHTVRTRWQRELHAVLVDEFQDTNDEQRAIIYALTGFGGQPANEDHDACRPYLFIVGDGKQSIYRFRGADVSVFRAVAADMRSSGGRTVALDTSFRTHALLLEWINTVSAHLFARSGTLRPYEVPFERLQPHRPAPPHEHCAELHIIENRDESDNLHTTEARTIAARLQHLCTGGAGALVYDRQQQQWRTPHYGDIALLFRASTAFEFYEQALREAGIPYMTTAGRGYYGRKEVQDLIHLLTVLYDPTDEVALVGVLRSPLFALDDETLLHLHFAEQSGLWEALLHATVDSPHPEALAFARETLRDLHAMRGRVRVVELLREVLARTGYLATISGLSDGERRRVNVEKLVQAVREMGSGGLTAFSTYLEELLRYEPREGEAPLESAGSVRLMTVHRSKGLEFPVVVLPDLGRGSTGYNAEWLASPTYGLSLKLRYATADWQYPVAFQLAKHEEQRMEQAEHERLLYVAMTRAQDYLIMSGPLAKKDSTNWFSRLINALGWSWEGNAPTAGCYGALEVFVH